MVQAIKNKTTQKHQPLNKWGDIKKILVRVGEKKSGCKKIGNGEKMAKILYKKIRGEKEDHQYNIQISQEKAHKLRD